MSEENNKMIADLQEQIQQQYQKISFNNVKLMILRKQSETVIDQYIQLHYDTYQDKNEKELLITFKNSKL